MTTAALVPVLVALCAWSGWYAWAVRRRRRVLPILDAAVLSGVALCSTWLVPVSWLVSGKSWIVPFVAFAGVGYQYSCARAVGLLCAIGLLGLTGLGTFLALPPGASSSTVVSSVWSAVIALLAALLWRLIERGGSRADAALADLDDAEHDRAVAVLLRQDQRAIAASLHDTAASTLLMIGLGEVSGTSDALAARARHDLEVIRTFGMDAEGGDAALVPALAAACEHHDIAVSLVVDIAPVLPRRAVDALVGAVTEALNNVARHAATTTAVVAVAAQENGVTVRVSDAGRGFDPSFSTARRGIRFSIEERMAGAGGRAVVRSAIGVGTTVDLEWLS